MASNQRNTLMHPTTVFHGQHLRSPKNCWQHCQPAHRRDFTDTSIVLSRSESHHATNTFGYVNTKCLVARQASTVILATHQYRQVWSVLARVYYNDCVIFGDKGHQITFCCFREIYSENIALFILTSFILHYVLLKRVPKISHVQSGQFIAGLVIWITLCLRSKIG